VPQFLRHGDTWRGVVWNASPDEIEEIEVHRPAEMPQPTTATQITVRGERVVARIEGERVTCARPLGQWECVVLC